VCCVNLLQRAHGRNNVSYEKPERDWQIMHGVCESTGRLSMRALTQHALSATRLNYGLDANEWQLKIAIK
jgi:hypothetical protein